MNSSIAQHVELLAQADLLLLVRQLVAQPTESLVRELAIDEQDLAEFLNRAGVDASSPVDSALRQALTQAASVELDTWAAEHSRLFEGAIFCPINETAYIRRDKGVIIADLCGFYHAFGFELAEDITEKPDHLICELEFAARLLVLLADAHERENAEHIDVSLGALQSYSCDHLGEWIVSFAERLMQATSLEIYQHIATTLDAIWALICTTRGLPLPSDVPTGPADDDPGSPYECDMACDPDDVVPGPSSS